MWSLSIPYLVLCLSHRVSSTAFRGVPGVVKWVLHSTSIQQIKIHIDLDLDSRVPFHVISHCLGVCVMRVFNEVFRGFYYARGHSRSKRV